VKKEEEEEEQQQQKQANGQPNGKPKVEVRLKPVAADPQTWWGRCKHGGHSTACMPGARYYSIATVLQ
jgi:hypothetical protein